MTDDMTHEDQQPDPVEEQQPGDDGQKPEDEGQQPAGGRDAAGEAARYRRRAQEAEAARDALQARVDAADRAEVLRLAAGHLFTAEDLLLVTDLAALRDADGTVDEALVKAACEKAVEARPNWRKPTGSHYVATEYEQDDGSFVRVMRQYRGQPGVIADKRPRSAAERFFGGAGA